MEISYLGGSSFLIRDERTVAINPSDRSTAADVVVHTRRQRSRKHIVNGPGEYEIGGVLIVTTEAGPREDSTLVHALELGGANVVHHGKPHGRLEARAIEALGAVDVLLINADDLLAAKEALRDLQPQVVIPYGGHAGELCAELGVTEPRPELRFTWNGTAKAPRAVLLRAPSKKRSAA